MRNRGLGWGVALQGLCSFYPQSAKSSKEGREQRGGCIWHHSQSWGEGHQGLGLVGAAGER